MAARSKRNFDGGGARAAWLTPPVSPAAKSLRSPACCSNQPPSNQSAPGPKPAAVPSSTRPTCTARVTPPAWHPRASTAGRCCRMAYAFVSLPALRRPERANSQTLSMRKSHGALGVNHMLRQFHSNDDLLAAPGSCAGPPGHARQTVLRQSRHARLDRGMPCEGVRRGRFRRCRGLLRQKPFDLFHS